MELYNSVIERIPGLSGKTTPKRWAYEPGLVWPENPSFEMVMLRDAAFELGGSGKPSVNFTCVTSSPKLVDRDEVLLCGPDLRQIKADTPFLRISLLRVGDIESDDEDDTEQAFRAIQELDFVKYKVFPKGYMIRTSSDSDREQVRVSREAIRVGVSFLRIGNTFIRHYRRNPNVLAAKVVFVTAPDADYAAARKCARDVRNITMSLSQILKGMPTDCGSCNLKPICDEVEGMKELHFGRMGMQG